MTADRNLLRRLARREDGTAAIEFALVMPLFIMLFIGSTEVTERFTTRWDVGTYNHQVGDYLSRSANLTRTDFDDVYEIRDRIMQLVDTSDAEVSLRFISVGYRENGDPTILWDEEIGAAQLAFDVEEARGLASHGQSVLFTITRVRTDSTFTRFGGAHIDVTKSSYFRPRITRAIGLDGRLTEDGRIEPGYTDDGSSGTGEPVTGGSA